MYSGHATTAALALRAKRSFALHHHLRLSDDANNNSSSSESYHSLVSVSPRVLLYRYYYSRHSALVRWAPSYRIVSVGGSRYSRLASGCCCCCCCYCGGGGSCNVGGSDGRFQGMLGLLAEAEGEAVVGTVEFAKVEKIGYRDMGDGGRRRMKEARSREGEDFVRGGDYGGRRVGKGDGFPKSGVQRSGRSQFSTKSGFRNGYSEQWGSGSANSVQSEVVWDRERSSSSLSNSAVRAKHEERVWEEKRRSREEREKNSGALEARESGCKKFSDANVEQKEEDSALALSLLEEVRRQRSEIDELNKNYQTLLLKRSEEEHATSVRAATSIQASSSKLEESEQISTAIVDLVDELKMQRVEIDRLLRSHRELITSSEIHETDVERISSLNKVFLSRSRDREESSTSTLNLIEEEKQQHNHAEQLRKEYQRNAPSSQKRESNAQKVSGADSSSALVLNDRDESSTSVVNSVDKLKEQYSHSDQFRRDYKKLNESSEVPEINTNRASTSNKVAITNLKGREQSTTLDANMIEERRASTSNKVAISSTTGREQSSTLDANLVPFGQFRKDKNALMKSSEIHKIDTKTASTSNKVTTISSKGSEQSSSLAGNFLEERRRQHTSVDQVRIDNSTLWQSSKMHEVGSTERASSSKESMSRSRYKEKTSDSAVYLFGESTGQLGYNDQFRKDEYKLLKSAVAEKADTDSSSSSYRIPISKSTDAEKRSTSAVNLIEEGKEKYYHAYQPYQETVGSGNSEETSDVEERIIDLPLSSGMELENAEGSSSLMMVQEAEERTKVNVSEKSKSSGWKLAAESFGRVSDGSSSTAYLDDQQLDEQSGRNDLVRVKHDMLDSARRLDKSSSQYVGEFVDKLREEMLVSDESDAMSKYSSRINMEMTLLEDGQSAGGSQHGVVDGAEDYKLGTILQEGPGQSSASSEEKGPSDEMWDATDPSFVAPSRKEKPEKEPSEVAPESSTMPANSGNAIVKRSGRSMWSFIADIIRMGWITRAESHKSTVQSGTRSSSNESVSSDAWFSGHEREEEDDERTNKGRWTKAKEPLLSKRPVGHQISELQVSGQEAEATTFENRLAKEHTGGSQFVGTTGRTNVSVDSLTVSESGTSTAGGKDEFGILSAGTAAVLPSVVIDSSPLPMTQLEITGIHTAEMHGIGFTKSKEEPVGGNLAGIAETAVKDSDLRKRKFHRNNQVVRENFEEWEEAHKLEMEQRKADEFFMREALLEAKKAADTWEVPIGAVLVQNGNIIARGSNLVEELRDSTAHAEMICIREASNLLRTWRLSDTTLYVTLEPCPMCAGAILQARVDTMVWGAPNKLLGADGSWVRLFPSGDEGKDDLGQSSETAGPVHPFHPKISIRRGILATECSEVMQQFFQLRRKKDKKKEEEPEPSRLPIASYPKKLLTRMHGIFSMMFCL